MHDAENGLTQGSRLCHLTQVTDAAIVCAAVV